jgi:hypothetical protein
MFLFYYKYVGETATYTDIAEDENHLPGHGIVVIESHKLSPLEIFLLEKIEKLKERIEDLENKEESRSFSEFYERNQGY